MLRKGRGGGDSPLISTYHTETEIDGKHGLGVFVLVCARYEGISGSYRYGSKNYKEALTIAKKSIRALAVVNAS